MKKTKHGDYERKVILPIWARFHFYVVFTDDFKKSYESRYGGNQDFSKTGAFHKYTRTGASHVFFKIGDCKTGTIAHECYHAAIAMLDRWAGVNPDKLDEELVAYHLDYFVQQVTDFKNKLIDSGLGVKSKRSKR